MLLPFFSYYIIIFQGIIQWILFRGKGWRIRGFWIFFLSQPIRNPGKRYEHEDGKAAFP